MHVFFQVSGNPTYQALAPKHDKFGPTMLGLDEKLEAAGIRTIMDRCFAVDLAKFGR